MWKFKAFAQKEPTGLEGRIIDIGDIKVHIKNVIAEGGFSSVYLAKDASNPSKQYALKHIICNDQESLDLAMKEISVLKSLIGHPNVVTLYASTILDMGRTKEALLVMEYCDKSLVTVLENRGAGYFEEKQVLSIFRDVCNAVFAMHCHSPPIAHRDLKAENLLLGSDGLWKLCDFGSTSTNHKRFEKPEEMGVEEDIIRKHTTPAYRAPEMWDLYRKDIINEKVDIWALGCLLFRICYLKSAFDGESKLQVLNGNYRIPDLPKFSASTTDLIHDMLNSSPKLRPDITQVWFRVNEQLPMESQKSLPDQPPQMREAASLVIEGTPKAATKASYPMPRRNPPPVPSSNESIKNTSSLNASKGGAVAGAFWSTEHAKDTQIKEVKGAPKFDDDSTFLTEDKSHREKHTMPRKVSPSGRGNSQSERFANFDDAAFNTFIADFDTSKLSPSVDSTKPVKDNSLEAEVERLRGQLKQANIEKAEITSKYEKLSAICRSQRHELQELKQALAARTPSPNKESVSNRASAIVQPSKSQRQGNEGKLGELQQGLFNKNSPNTGTSWQPFTDDTSKKAPVFDSPKSVRTRNGNPGKQDGSTGSINDEWGFGNESFSAVPSASARISRSSGEGNKSQSQRFGDSNKLTSKTASQPAGWSGF
ncbi:uncharacterized protein LOC141653123 [Silene latifolia]|uniref:uncharacterized protein LOC141653123 n=1 Tax=Silene latifolia TaxID=37657 RepID=UPI003D788344